MAEIVQIYGKQSLHKNHEKADIIPTSFSKFGNYWTYSYSPSHIIQITDFLDFLHEYCEEKIETFIEF